MTVVLELIRLDPLTLVFCQCAHIWPTLFYLRTVLPTASTSHQWYPLTGFSSRCCHVYVLFYLFCNCILLETVGIETNQDTVAPLVLQMALPSYKESLEYPFTRQNLSRVTTAELSGPKVVKVHSTCPRLLYSKEVPQVNTQIPSAPFLLAQCSLQAKVHILQGPHGI